MPKRQFNEDFDQWIDDLSPEDHKIVFERACADLELERDLSGAMFLIDSCLYGRDFLDALDVRYQHMYMGDLMDMLVEAGRIKPDGVDEDGNIQYVPVEAS